MRLVPVLREIGNRVYDRAFPIYVLCYRVFKAYADRAERKLLRRTLCSGDVAIDVGANIGIYTQLLSVGSVRPGLFTRLNLRPRISGACRVLRESLQMCAYRSPQWANPAGELHSTFRINSTSIIARICPKEIRVIQCLSK